MPEAKRYSELDLWANALTNETSWEGSLVRPAPVPTTVNEQHLLGPLLDQAFNAQFNPRYTPAPTPTLDEHRANCTALGLIVCTCTPVEYCDRNDGQERVLLINPKCKVHRG